MTMSADERARLVAEFMWKDDNASTWMGFELGEVGEGRAVMSMTVQARHANGHGMCHGGVTFALADSAFAYACNSRNLSTVAQHNSITYLAPGRVGDCLTADAREQNLSGRSGIYDVVVRNQDTIVIAEFRGLSRSIGGTIFDESPTE